LRTLNDGSENRHRNLRAAVRGLAFSLVLLVMIRVLGQRVLSGVAGAALILILQEFFDPTPLFWVAPWEALRLILSQRHRANHLWLHRTQAFACESIGRRLKSDGFAIVDGFVVTGVGHNKQLLQWTANTTCRMTTGRNEKASLRLGCKTVRFLIAVCIMIGCLLGMSVWRRIDITLVLIISSLSAAIGHGLARPIEKLLAEKLVALDRKNGDQRVTGLSVEPIEFPEWLWWPGSLGFIVRQIRKDGPGEDSPYASAGQRDEGSHI
jgi:hypothetical protein